MGGCERTPCTPPGYGPVIVRASGARQQVVAAISLTDRWTNYDVNYNVLQTTLYLIVINFVPCVVFPFGCKHRSLRAAILVAPTIFAYYQAYEQKAFSFLNAVLSENVFNTSLKPLPPYHEHPIIDLSKCFSTVWNRFVMSKNSSVLLLSCP